MKNNKIIRSFTLFFLLVFALEKANAQDAFINNEPTNATLESYMMQLPKGTNSSLLIQTTDKIPQTIFSYQNDQLRLPASIQKLVTALAAELELGPKFHFVTRMQTNGKIVKNQLKGDLIIQMSGDPTLTRQKLLDMLATLKLKKINQINGNIIIDSSIFSGHDKASGWSWNNLTACYNTQPSAIIIDNNCFYTTITPAKNVGENAKISTTLFEPIVMNGNVKTIDPEDDDIRNKYCELNIIAYDKNNYHLTGCIKKSTQKTYLKFAVNDPFDYFSSILKSELAKKKIHLNGKIIETKEKIDGALYPLAVNQSAPLPELLMKMLKKSDNLIADTLFKTIGAHHFNMQGTWQNSSDAVKEILSAKAEINLENTVINDGSGLSRINFISADKLMQILQYIAKNDKKLNMVAMLPIAGVDGTLQYNKGFTGKLKNRVFAKTGHLEGIYNLAGFIEVADKQYIAFVQLISDYYQLNHDSDSRIIDDFEKNFYSLFLAQSALHK